MKTTQEIFTIVKEHLLTQKAKCTAPGVGCAYRGANGMRCAVGILIADEYYTPAMEGGCPTALAPYDANPEDDKDSSYFVTTALIKSGVGDEHHKLLNSLQAIHDSIDSSLEVWIAKLQDLAAIHGLKYE